MVLIGTVYLERITPFVGPQVAGEAEPRPAVDPLLIPRQVSKLDVPTALDFKLRWEQRAEQDRCVVSFGPIGEPWGPRPLRYAAWQDGLCAGGQGER